MDDDNQLSDKELANKRKIELFEESIWTQINKMKDSGLTEFEFNNMLFKLNNIGSVDIYLKGMETRKGIIPPVKFANADNQKGITYKPEAIKRYEEICKTQEVEAQLPKNLPNFNAIKERQGDDTRTVEPPKKEEKAKQENDLQQNDDQAEKNRQNNKTEKSKTNENIKPSPNSIKLQLNRAADLYEVIRKRTRPSNRDK